MRGGWEEIERTIVQALIEAVEREAEDTPRRPLLIFDDQEALPEEVA